MRKKLVQLILCIISISVLFGCSSSKDHFIPDEVRLNVEKIQNQMIHEIYDGKPTKEFNLKRKCSHDFEEYFELTGFESYNENAYLNFSRPVVSYDIETHTYAVTKIYRCKKCRGYKIGESQLYHEAHTFENGECTFCHFPERYSKSEPADEK